MSNFILSNDKNIVKSLRLKDVPADYNGPVISVSDGNKKLKSTKAGRAMSERDKDNIVMAVLTAIAVIVFYALICCAFGS